MSPREFKAARTGRRMALTAVLVLTAVVCVIIYAGLHDAFSADGMTGNQDAQLARLARSESLFPFNPDSLIKSGVIRLTRATENLADFKSARADILGANRDFRRALTLDPCSASGHFYYARTLTLMTFIGGGGGDDPFQEFEKAARLAGPNLQLKKEIGLALLGQWDRLSGSQRTYTEKLLNRSLPRNDLAGFREILYLWFLGIKDYGVMRRIMPASSGMMRSYARFLAERSLSIAARHEALAAAESLEFDQATKDYDEAQRLVKYGVLDQAISLLTRCRETLKGIKFFGHLAGAPAGGDDAGLDAQKKDLLWKSAVLALAKAKLERNRKLEDADSELREFLDLEPSYVEVTDLDAYLKDLRIIPENESEVSLRDVRQLSFEVLLMFRLHKYRQIVSLGSQLQHSLVVPEEATRKDLSEIFMLIADAYLKLDFVYESEGFYQRALELAPNDLGVLSRMKKYYERRNDADKIREVDRSLSHVLTGGQLLPAPRMLAKDAVLEQSLLMAAGQKRIRVGIQLGLLPGNAKPLVGVYLNGRVVSEDYAAEPAIDLELETLEGLNRLEIRAENGPVGILKLSVSDVTAADTAGGAGPGEPKKLY